MDRTELGAALRTLRRRTPGLRREEVASMAGMSVDYLTRLEQGRGPHPSDAVLTALARALRVKDAERDHLFHLAGGSPPRPGRIRSTVRPSVLRLMDRVTDLPAVLLDAKTDVLAWNPMAAALLGDMSAIPLGQRNIARMGFGNGDRRMGGADALSPAEARGNADPAERERLDRALVSDLRRAAARYPDDPGLRTLVHDLRRVSGDFARLWDLRDLDERHGDRKRLQHPQLGMLELDCDTLLVHADDQVMLVYSAAPGTPEAQALDLLRVVGLQELRGHRLPSTQHVDG